MIHSYINFADGAITIVEHDIVYFDNDKTEFVLRRSGSAGGGYGKLSWSPTVPGTALGSQITFTIYDGAPTMEEARDSETVERQQEGFTRVSRVREELEFLETIDISAFEGDPGARHSLSWNPADQKFFLSDGKGVFYVYNDDFIGPAQWTYSNGDGDNTIIVHSLSFAPDGSVAAAVAAPENGGATPGLWFFPSPADVSDSEYDKTEPHLELVTLDDLDIQNTRRVARDGNGNIFVIATNIAGDKTGTIKRYSRNGDEDNWTANASYTIDGDDFYHDGFENLLLCSIRVDRNDRVYVTLHVTLAVGEGTTAFDAVLQLDNDLAGVTEIWGAEGGNDWRFDRPADIAFDENNFMYVVSNYNNSVKVFDTADRFFTGFVLGSRDGPGRLSAPRTIEIVGERVYIYDTGSDTEGGRISVYKTIQ